MLQGIGFSPNLAQPPATLARFFAFFIGAPAVLIILGLAASTRFRITPATHAILKAELARLRSGGERSAASSETVRVCELLSGQAHAECWPDRKPRPS
jgi:oligogalacturonide transporter